MDFSTRCFQVVCILVWLALLPCCGVLATVQVTAVSGAGSADVKKAPLPSTQATVASLGWLAGNWTCETGGETVDEMWMPPRGEVMLGTNRTTGPAGKGAFEFMRIAIHGEQITLFASPGGRPATPFVLLESSDRHAIFGNEKNDFPQRVIYRLEQERLTGRIEGTIKGEVQSMEWTWSKVPALDSPAAKPGHGEASELGAASEKKETRMLLGLRTGVYGAPDLERAKAWYSQVLGSPPYFDQPFYVGFNVGGFELGLDPDQKPAGTDANPVAYWGVVSCRESFQRLVELGASPHSQPQEVGEGIVVASVLDPFGNILGIIENPHFPNTR